MKTLSQVKLIFETKTWADVRTNYSRQREMAAVCRFCFYCSLILTVYICGTRYIEHTCGCFITK